MCPLLRKEVLWIVTQRKNPRKRVRSKPRLWAFTHSVNKIICFRVIGIFPLDFIRCSAFWAMWLPTLFNLNCTGKKFTFSWLMVANIFWCVCVWQNCIEAVSEPCVLKTGFVRLNAYENDTRN